MTGARDLAIGAGALARASHTDTVFVLALVGAIADAGDLIAAVLAANNVGRARRVRWLVQGAVAAASAATTVLVLVRARRRPSTGQVTTR
jgi:hypothetical protein